MGLHWCRLVCAVVLMLDAACTSSAPDQPREWRTDTVGRPTPAPRRTAAHGAEPVATAVRLLSTDARSVPLSPADVPPNYHISAENIAVVVQLWAPPRRSASAVVNVPVGEGYYILLTRSDGPDEDGVVSLATSAVRYRSTQLAHDAFTAEVAVAGDDSLVSDDPSPADEVRFWSGVNRVVEVEQGLARRHNFLLSLTLVRVPRAAGRDIARKHLLTLESKLAE